LTASLGQAEIGSDFYDVIVFNARHSLPAVFERRRIETTGNRVEIDLSVDQK